MAIRIIIIKHFNNTTSSEPLSKEFNQLINASVSKRDDLLMSPATSLTGLETKLKKKKGLKFKNIIFILCFIFLFFLYDYGVRV